MSSAGQIVPLLSLHGDRIRNVCILAHVDHGNPRCLLLFIEVLFALRFFLLTGLLTSIVITSLV